MKNPLLLAAAIFFVINTSNAQNSNLGMLRIALTNNNDLTVEIDGRNYRKVAPQITIGNLPNGRHRIRIYQVGNGNSRRRATTVFNGRVKVRANAITDVLVDANRGSIQTSTTNIAYRGNSQNDVDYNEQQSTSAGNSNMEEKRVETTQRPERPSPPNTTAIGTSLPISDKKVETLKTKLDGYVTDTEKMQLLKKELAGKKLSASQLALLESSLAFESSKVELRKVVGMVE